MRDFDYLAYTATGRRVRGTVVAEDDRAAIDQLMARGLFPVEVGRGGDAAGAAPSTGLPRPRLGPRRVVLDLDERALFSRQMAVLLASAMPLDAALGNLADAEGSARIRRFAAQLRVETLQGGRLSDAMRRRGGGFPDFYTAALSAGEAAGRLDLVFGRLAEHIEQGRSRQQILATALAYPLFVGGAALAVCVFLVIRIAPELQVMFEATGRPLPASTRAVLSVGRLLTEHWPILAGGVCAVGLAVLAAMRQPRSRDAAQRLALRLPVLGGLMRHGMAAQYLRTFALVVDSRQTAVSALQAATGTIRVVSLRAEAEAAVKALSEGETLSRALRRVSFLPGMALQMIDVGDRTARVAVMAERAAVVIESQLDNRRRRLMALLDPLLMLVVGMLVLFVVLAVMLPIFDMQSAVQF